MEAKLAVLRGSLWKSKGGKRGTRKNGRDWQENNLTPSREFRQL